jgi:hypothetical protein
VGRGWRRTVHIYDSVPKSISDKEIRGRCKARSYYGWEIRNEKGNREMIENGDNPMK